MLAWLCLLSSTASAAESPITFDAWADSFCADWVRLSPERATFTQWFSGEEQATLDGQLSVLNKTTRQRQLALAQSGVARLDAWLATPLTPTQRAGAATMRWGLARTVAGEPYAEHDFVFHQTACMCAW